jgi:glycosyltransferase involved in cell wall biosynthesis
LALAPALGAVLNAHPLAELAVVGDRAVHDAIDSSNKSFHPLLNYADYWACMDNSDIVLLPLSDTPFNRCKSPLKFLEASARGVAALANPTVYNGLIRHGHNGLLFADGEEFMRGIEILITQPDQRRRLAEAARVEVMEDWRLTAGDFERRLAWYNTLDRDREALNRALISRAPELA